jgi:hypothetical protein
VWRTELQTVIFLAVPANENEIVAVVVFVRTDLLVPFFYLFVRNSRDNAHSQSSSGEEKELG